MPTGFPPIAAPDARVLILGSMPSLASLERGEYYGHPQNKFWPIMAELLGGRDDDDYAVRKNMLLDARIALWDTLKFAEREGSMDSAIVQSSEVPNDIAGFLSAHPRIHAIVFNGTKAETVFRRLIMPTLPQSGAMKLMRMPSTSPANASSTLSAKIVAWRCVLTLAAE